MHSRMLCFEGVLRRIGNPVLLNHCKGRQPVLVCFGLRHDVAYRPFPDRECISDQRSMTTPRDCLRAHDRRRNGTTARHEGFQRCSKDFGLHVVGIAAKACVLPACVDGIFPRFAQSAKVRVVLICETGFCQMPGQSMAIELGIVAGTGNRSHVDETLDAVGRQQGQELVDGFRRVADRPESHPPQYHDTFDCGETWDRAEMLTQAASCGDPLRTV